MISSRTISSTQRDVLIIALVVCLILFAEYVFSAFAPIFEIVYMLGGWRVHRFGFIVFLILASFAVFSYRRWRELQIEIAKHKAIEHELFETETRSKALVSSLPYLIFRVNNNGTVLEFQTQNPDQALEHPAIVAGAFVAEHLPEEVSTKYRIGITEVLKSNKIVSVYYSLRDNGNTRHFEARLAASGSNEVLVSLRSIVGSEHLSDALAQSETRFLEVVESLSEGLIITDSNDIILYINRRMEELGGWNLNEVLGRSAHEVFLDQRDWSRQQERNKERSQGTSESYELEVKRKDGTTFVAEVYGTPYRDLAGNINGTIGTIVDITEQRWNAKLQQALFEISEITLSPIDLQSLYVKLHEIVGRLMYAKNFYIALHDPVKNTISFPYFVDEIDEPPPTRIFSNGSTERIIRLGKVFHAPRRIFDVMTEKGEVEIMGAEAVDWVGVPLIAGEKTFGALVIQSYSSSIIFTQKEIDVLTFVSQHIATAIQRKSEEERFRVIWEHSADGMRVTDKDGFIIMVNDAYCTFVGKTKPELLGKLFSEAYDLSTMEDQHGLETYLKRFANGTIIRQLQTDITLWNGEKIPVEVTSSFISFGANEQMLLSIFRDIRERKKLEEQLLHAQKMDSIGVLAGGVAHDFNNVLTMILGSAEIVAAKSTNTPEIHKFANMIIAAAERGSSIAKQLLVFARSNKGYFKPVSLIDIVNDVCSLLEHTFPKSITLVKEFTAKNDVILGDSDQLHQVIINLAMNARDAIEQTQQSGKITFIVKNSQTASLLSRYTSHGTSTLVTLCVKDTGVGMDDKTAQKIFEPFFTTKEKGKGTGLGLSIVHGIVKSHNGIIETHSAVGKGTEISLSFPATFVVEEKPNGHDSEQSIRKYSSIPKQGYIMVVDDEEQLAEIMRESLESKGYHVITASDGEEALSHLRDQKKKIVLMFTDIGMPKLDGKELIRRVRGMNLSIKIVIITGYLDKISTHELTELGVSEIIQKPFALEQINEITRQLLALPA